MTFGWHDIRMIAQALVDHYPTIDPLTLRFTELHNYICQFDDFIGDPNASNEQILEAILTIWLEEIAI